MGSNTNRGDGANEMGDNLLEIDFGSDFIPIQITIGYHTCALSTTGKVKCWGLNAYGELGRGDTIDTGEITNGMGDNLTEVDLGSDFIAMQISANVYHTCALSTTYKAKCWGLNDWGELGQRDRLDRGDGPNEMGDNLLEIDFGSDFIPIQITIGYHTCALSTTGKVKCWGLNAYGELGRGDTIDTGEITNGMGDNLTEVDLGSDFIAMQISANVYHTCALSTTYKAKCWGLNDWGELGQRDRLDRGDGPNEMGDNLLEIELGSSFTSMPTPMPTSAPTTPTRMPTIAPTYAPTPQTSSPTSAPTTHFPTSAPTVPTRVPSSPPTGIWTPSPSQYPTAEHTGPSTKYTVSISFHNCEQENEADDCDINQTTITSEVNAVLVAYIDYDTKILSTDIINNEVVIVLSIGMDGYNPLIGERMSDRIENELETKYGDDIDVIVKETNDEDASAAGSADTEPNEENDLWLWIVVASAVVVAMILIVVMVYKRCKHVRVQKIQTTVEKQLQQSAQVVLDEEEQMDNQEPKITGDSTEVVSMINSLNRVPLTSLVTMGDDQTTRGND
eukprot:224207_1